MNNKNITQIYDEKESSEYAKIIRSMLGIFGIMHFSFIFLFLLLGVKEMVIYNIFSTAFFASACAATRKCNYTDFLRIDFVTSIEILLHQTLAVIFVGLDGGFQYFLFGMAAPIINYNLSKKFKHLYVFKSISAFIIFLTLEITYKTGIFVPIYTNVNANILNVNNSLIIATTFITIGKSSLDSYTRFKRKIEHEYELYKAESEKQIKTQQNIVGMVANIIEARDENTGQHTERTSKYVKLIAEQLKKNNDFSKILTPKYINDLSSAAMLHDIGKIKVPDTILNKPGKLTDEEYEIIKTHTTEGAKIIDLCKDTIQDEDYLKMAHDITLYHHERVDGNGYPTGISGKAIPLSARIMAVADVYDALISKRIYKEEFDKSFALEIIKDGSGKQFDENVVNAFFELVEKGDI